MFVTKRDTEIVRFVLNMKFASVTEIHHKFFKFKKDGGVSESEWWARERLRKLIDAGYLKSVKFRFESKNFYIGTKLGFKLASADKSQYTSKPTTGIDIRTFEHDYKVLQCRMLLEENEKVTDWQSDRELKELFFETSFHFRSRENSPDGVYKTNDGKCIAFEYEIAQKSEERIKRKIRRYVLLFQGKTFPDEFEYKFVRIVCEKQHVCNLFLKHMDMYERYFSLEMASDFFKSTRSPCEAIARAVENTL
jgi:hypothetical protein